MSLSKIRVYELAKMLEVPNKELMEILQALAVDVKTHMSSIDTDVAQILEETVRERRKKESAAGMILFRSRGPFSPKPWKYRPGSRYGKLRKDWAWERQKWSSTLSRRA